MTFNFALQAIAFINPLKSKMQSNTPNQPSKSGTSDRANMRKSQNAVGTADFIHKMKIIAKVANETECRLKLRECAETYLNLPFDLFEPPQSIAKVISKIMVTSKCG